MYAIVEFKGNQIKLIQGKETNIPYFESKNGESVVFDKILVISDEKGTRIGSPDIKDAKVEAKVVGAISSPKIPVVKFHSKKRYQRIGSHRQDYVRIMVDKITA